MSHDHRTYQRMRRAGAGASSAYAYARAVSELSPEVDPGGYAFERDGYALRVTVTPDEWADDWRGSFSDDWAPGAVLTDSHRHEPRDEWTRNREWRYFVPTITAEEHRRGLSQAGYARHVADCLAREYVERDYRAALERSDYVVAVTASREGVELGAASLGGVDLGDDWTDAAVYLADIADDLAGEAIDAARDALERLAATA